MNQNFHSESWFNVNSGDSAFKLMQRLQIITWPLANCKVNCVVIVKL